MSTTFIHSARDCKTDNDSCSFELCAKMKKDYIPHALKCKKTTTFCDLCAELVAFCVPHTEICTAAYNSCVVPFCNRLKIIFRKNRHAKVFRYLNNYYHYFKAFRQSFEQLIAWLLQNIIIKAMNQNLK